MYQVVEYGNDGEVKWFSDSMTYTEARELWEKKAVAKRRRFAIRKAA